MNAVDKELLLKDLCARLPYRVRVHYKTAGWEDKNCILTPQMVDNMLYRSDVVIKSYLRPMSSMTEEEKKEYYHMSDVCVGYDDEYSTITVFDWLNKHHFDYRGLIEKGLAIDVTKYHDPYE